MKVRCAKCVGLGLVDGAACIGCGGAGTILLAPGLPFHTTRCYACSDVACGVRDRRPEGGVVESACKRHADRSLRAFPACCYCSGPRPTIVIDSTDLAHASCHARAVRS